MANTVNQVYGATLGEMSSLEILVGTLLFAIQIYCDFAGYSNIARGVAKFLGIDLMLNFNFPIYSKNPKEFWSRWHISLSSWLRDYLYISLGGNKKGHRRTYYNLMLTMLLGGLWHGAAWNFILWGFYQGSLLIIHRMIQFQISIKNNFLKQINIIYKIIMFFIITNYGWLLFRSPVI